MSFTVRLISDHGVTEQREVNTIEDDGEQITVRWGSETFCRYHHENIRHIDVFWNKVT